MINTEIFHIKKNISGKWPVNRLEWDKTSKFTEDLNKNYGNGKIGYFLKIDVQCPVQLSSSDNYLTFLSENFKYHSKPCM